MTRFKIVKPLPCPNCHHLIAPSELKNKPFDGKLKWYEITPAPTQHCPYCHVQLQLAGWCVKKLIIVSLCLMGVLLHLIIIMLFGNELNLVFVLFLIFIAVIFVIWAYQATYYELVQ